MLQPLPTTKMALGQEEEEKVTNQLIQELPTPPSPSPQRGSPPSPPTTSQELITPEIPKKDINQETDQLLAVPEEKPVEKLDRKAFMEYLSSKDDELAQMVSKPRVAEVMSAWGESIEQYEKENRAYLNDYILNHPVAKAAEEEESWLHEMGDFGFYAWQGVKASVDNAFDTVEGFVNNTFNTEVDLWDVDYEKPSEDDGSDTAGFIIGTQVLPLVAGGAAVKFATSLPLLARYMTAAGAGSKWAKRMATYAAFEVGYGTAAQFTQDLKEPILWDLLFDDPKKWTDEEKQRFKERGFAEPEAIRRLKVATENAVTGLGGAVAFDLIAQGIGKPIVKAYTNQRIKAIANTMTGGANNALNQRQRLEAWLVSEKGMTRQEAAVRVYSTMSYNPNMSLEGILRTISRDARLEDIDVVVKNDDSLRKEILARNLAESQLEGVGPVESARLVEGWVNNNALDRKIYELSEREFGSFLEDANMNASRVLSKKRGPNESPLMGKLEETLRVEMEDAAHYDGVLQKTLTGVGHDAVSIARAGKEGSIFWDDVSQSPYVLNVSYTQRHTARLINATRADNAFSKYRPTLPTPDGSLKYANAKTLGNIQKDAGMNDTVFDEFLKYRRALKLKHDIGRGIQSPIDETTLDSIIAAGRVNETFRAADGDFSNLMRYLLDYSLASGEKNIREVTDMLKASTNADGEFIYFPRHILEEDGEQFIRRSGKQSAFKELKGTDKTLKDPFTDVVQQISTVIYRGEENILKRSRYNMINKAANMTGDSNVSRVAKEIAEEVRVPNKEDYMRKHPDKVFDTFWENGKFKVWEIKDPALMRILQIRNVNNEADTFKNVVAKGFEFLAKGTRPFTHAITKTPAFAIKAFIRDAYYVEFASPIGLLPRGRSVQGLFSLVFNRDVINEMGAAGFHGGTQTTELGVKIKDLNRLKAANASAEEIAKAERGNFLTQAAHKGVSWWTSFVNNAEMSSRVGEYLVAKRQGYSPALSSYFAMDSAVNFAKSGTSTAWRSFTDTQAFFRANYLGMSKTAEVIKNNPLKAGLYLGSMAAFLNSTDAINSLYPDWQNKTAYDKNTWIYLPNVPADKMLSWVKGGMKGEPPVRDKDAPWITIPAPFELQVFSRTSSRLYNLLTDQGYNDTLSKTLRDGVTGILPPMSAYGVTPTLVSPFIELARNETKQGLPIFQNYQAGSLFKEDIINPTTGDSAIWLSNASKYVSSLFSDNPQAWFSPVGAEHIERSLLVGWGEYLKNSLDWWARPENKGAPMDTPFGDKSRQANFFKWVAEESGAIFFDSSIAGRGYKNFIYDMQALSREYQRARGNNVRNFQRVFGRGTVRDYTGEEKLAAAISPFTSNVLDRVREADNRILQTRNDDKLSPEAKLKAVRALTEFQNMLIQRYINTLDREDPDKVLRAWDSLTDKSR